MAMKHRKLFPSLAANQTDNFDPSCPYGCEPYSDFYFSPPPPSPPPPPPPLSGKHGDHPSLYVIISVTFLGSIFVLFSYYAIMRLRRSSARSDGPGEEFLDHNHGPAIDHPIWYINTIGLQPSVINSITVVKYKKDDSLIEGTDCSVCLNEFIDEETLRLLPKCNHAFHIPCIDTWLRSHTNCPLCRAGIFSNTWNVALASSNDQASQNLGSNGNSQFENFENVNEFDGGQVGDENRAETGDGIDFPQAEDELKEIENVKVTQPMRRSVSMDGASQITVVVREFRSVKCEGSSIDAESLDKGPVSVKRSISCGGRSVFSRH